MTDSDETLMQAAAQGDLAAFEQLVVRHQLLAWRVAYRLLGCRHTAEDVAQEAFLRIFQAADRYQPTASFRTYLYRVVLRLCLDRLRKRSAVPAEDLEDVAESAASPEQAAVCRERERAVQDALHHLPARQRMAIVLRYDEGLSSHETAAAMETSVKAVERLLARGRSALKQQLAALLSD